MYAVLHDSRAPPRKPGVAELWVLASFSHGQGVKSRKDPQTAERCGAAGGDMGKVTLALFLVGATLLVVGLPQLSAQPLGSEFQVNTYTTGNQRVPFLLGDAVASAEAGAFVVNQRQA